MEQNTTLNLNDLIVTFGTLHITGYSDGDFITIAYNNAWWNHQSGAYGEVASIRNNRLDATVKINILQTSQDNDQMMAFLLSDYASNLPLPLYIRDLNGNSLYESAKARIDKVPDVIYSTDPQSREWNIFCPRLVPFVGGNIK